jgi:hypothetical protein
MCLLRARNSESRDGHQRPLGFLEHQPTPGEFGERRLKWVRDAHRTPTWPWAKDDTLQAALSAAVGGPQLDIGDIELSDRALEELAELSAGEADSATDAVETPPD